MEMKEKYPELDSLFGAYFNQDWNLDYDSPEAVIRAFARDDTKALEHAIEELKILLKEEHIKAEWYKIISDDFGCEYSLRLRNIEPIEWLRKVQKQLEEELSLAKSSR